MNLSSRFILGTAQLGMGYGIANKHGKPDSRTARDIIEEAWKRGVVQFDTAQAYGDSESVLGNCFKNLGIQRNVRVIGKLDPASYKKNNDEILASIESSLRKLNIERFAVLLLHGTGDLGVGSEKWREIFSLLKENRFVENVGISIYESADVEAALELEYIDAIQVSFNFFDRRAIDRGWFSKAKKANKIIYIRSVFLQGFLLMKTETLPAKMDFAKTFLEYYSSRCDELKLSQREFALLFAYRYSNGFPLVIGVDYPGQLSENLETIQSFAKHEVSNFKEESLRFSGKEFERLINPSKWSS